MFSIKFRKFITCFVITIFSGCSSSPPRGPKVAVMPAPGKPFDQFVGEDTICRQYASQSIGEVPRGISTKAVGEALGGAALGSAAGALIGGRQGAGVGAGAGLIIGSATAAGEQGYETHDIQWSYDTAYSQCMYAKGNQVPGYQIQQAPPPLPPKK